MVNKNDRWKNVKIRALFMLMSNFMTDIKTMVSQVDFARNIFNKAYRNARNKSIGRVEQISQSCLNNLSEKPADFPTLRELRKLGNNLLEIMWLPAVSWGLVSPWLIFHLCLPAAPLFMICTTLANANSSLNSWIFMCFNRQAMCSRAAASADAASFVRRSSDHSRAAQAQSQASARRRTRQSPLLTPTQAQEPTATVTPTDDAEQVASTLWLCDAAVT